MIANPIIRKEVLAALRTRKAALMQALLLLGTAALIWQEWPSEGLQGAHDAQRILAILAMGELVMIAMFAPAFTAAALTSEKERNTFESLFATMLTPLEIAMGKIVGALAFVVLLVVTGAVAMVAPLLLGGVGAGQVLAVIGVLLVTAVYLGVIGLFVSTMVYRSYRAIIITYGLLFVLLLLFAMPAWPLSNHLIHRGPLWWQDTLHVLASLSPLEAMISLVFRGSDYSTGVQNMPKFWQLYMFVSPLATLLLGAGCVYRLRRPAAPPRPREGLRVIERDGKLTGRSVFMLVDPRKRKRMISWWQNPVLIKEVRMRPLLQLHWLLRAFSITVISAVLLMFIVSLGVQAFVAESPDMVSSMAAAVAAMMALLILLVGPATSSGAICSDRETGVWDLMRATRLSSWTIVSGKLQASIIPVLLLAAAMVPALVVLVLLGNGNWPEAGRGDTGVMAYVRAFFDQPLWPSVARVICVIGVTILFVVCAGMFFSSLVRKTATATAWTYGLILAFGLSSLVVLLRQERFAPQIVRAVFTLNPIAAAMDAAGSPAMAGYGGIYPNYLKLFGALSGAMFVVTVARVLMLRRPR
jgi:ABC-type transport system involved in multi-copper enzyme maturation permease subunit